MNRFQRNQGVLVNFDLRLLLQRHLPQPGQKFRHRIMFDLDDFHIRMTFLRKLEFAINFTISVQLINYF